MDFEIEEVLEDFYELINKLEIPATFFITNDSKVLDKFRHNELFELGVHPNFNKLLSGVDTTKNCFEIFQSISKIVPDAVSYRSHSLTDSSLFDDTIRDMGIKYNLNYLIFPYRGMNMQPYSLEWGGIRIPFIFEDDVNCLTMSNWDFKYIFSDTYVCPRVLSFHPIHLFLNTYKVDTYMRAKEDFQNIFHLRECIDKKNYGIRNIFTDMIKEAKADGWQIMKIRDYPWADIVSNI